MDQLPEVSIDAPCNENNFREPRRYCFWRISCVNSRALVDFPHFHLSLVNAAIRHWLCSSDLRRASSRYRIYVGVEPALHLIRWWINRLQLGHGSFGWGLQDGVFKVDRESREWFHSWNLELSSTEFGGSSVLVRRSVTFYIAGSTVRIWSQVQEIDTSIGSDWAHEIMLGQRIPRDFRYMAYAHSRSSLELFLWFTRASRQISFQHGLTQFGIFTCSGAAIRRFVMHIRGTNGA